MRLAPLVRPRRLLRGAAAAAAAIAMTALSCAPATAHASLVTSSPSDGSTLARGPSSVVLTFDQNIQDPSQIRVIDRAGNSVNNGDTTVLNATVRQAVHIHRDGTYVITYRVVSADGHVVSGDLRFAVGNGPVDQSAPAASSAGGGRHLALLVALAVIVVGLVVLFVRPRRRTRPSPASADTAADGDRFG